MRELAARLPEGGTYARADLDLGLQELGRHLALEEGLALGEHGLGCGIDKGPRAAVDEEILLLDAERESRLGDGHR